MYACTNVFILSLVLFIQGQRGETGIPGEAGRQVSALSLYISIYRTSYLYSNTVYLMYLTVFPMKTVSDNDAATGTGYCSSSEQPVNVQWHLQLEVTLVLSICERFSQ